MLPQICSVLTAVLGDQEMENKINLTDLHNSDDITKTGEPQVEA